MTNGETIQMPLLRWHPNHLERLSNPTTRQGAIEAVQALRPALHHQEKGGSMSTDIDQRPECLLGLQDVVRLHQLREMLRHCNRRIAKLKKLPASLQGDLAQEKAFASMTLREVQRVEKSLLESEMGFQ